MKVSTKIIWLKLIAWALLIMEIIYYLKSELYIFGTGTEDDFYRLFTLISTPFIFITLYGIAWILEEINKNKSKKR